MADGEKFANMVSSRFSADPDGIENLPLENVPSNWFCTIVLFVQSVHLSHGNDPGSHSERLWF